VSLHQLLERALITQAAAAGVLLMELKEQVDLAVAVQVAQTVDL